MNSADRVWIIKRRQPGAVRDEYLWSRNGSDLNWHATQGGAWRFSDRSEACRAVYAANCWAGMGTARLVRLVRRTAQDPTVKR